MVDTIVGEEDQEAVQMILGRCGISALRDGDRIIGFRDKQGVRGGFLCERYTGPGGSIHVHWAGRDKHWLKGYMLTLVGMYVFDQLSCEIMYGEVRAKDEAVRKIDEKLGFDPVARLAGYFPNDDLIIYEVRKNDFTWLPDEFKDQGEVDGRERRSA